LITIFPVDLEPRNQIQFILKDLTLDEMIWTEYPEQSEVSTFRNILSVSYYVFYDNTNTNINAGCCTPVHCLQNNSFILTILNSILNYSRGVRILWCKLQTPVFDKSTQSTEN